MDWNTPKVTKYALPKGKEWKVKEYMQNMVMDHAKKYIDETNQTEVPPEYLLSLTHDLQTEGNTVVTQVTFHEEFEFEIVFVSHSAHAENPSDGRSPFATISFLEPASRAQGCSNPMLGFFLMISNSRRPWCSGGQIRF
jgi:hypothetical protein